MQWKKRWSGIRDTKDIESPKRQEAMWAFKGVPFMLVCKGNNMEDICQTA